MDSKQEQQVMTKREVCDFLRIDPKTLDKLVRAGEIPRVVVTPACIRFNREDVLDYLRRAAARG